MSMLMRTSTLSHVSRSVVGKHNNHMSVCSFRFGFYSESCPNGSSGSVKGSIRKGGLNFVLHSHRSEARPYSFSSGTRPGGAI